MRLVALLPLLLLATACAPEVVPDRSDFCGIPASACGKRLVDEHGHAHTVVCGAHWSEDAGP